MAALRMIDTFSGIGGFSLAARWLGGIETVAFVEREPFCQRILSKHWPTVPIHDDIRRFRPEPESADLVTAGWPCTNISQAGDKSGLQGPASGLFREVVRVVRQVRPAFIVLENSSELVRRGLDDVLGELALLGYDAEGCCIRASDVGAPFDGEGRNRMWIVAFSDLHRRDGAGISRQSFGQMVASPPWRRCAVPGLSRAASHYAQAEPRVGRVADGVPSRVDRIKALGNAVVPQVAMVPLARVLQLAGSMGGR